MDSPGLVVIYITCADPGEAETIGRALVGERLVACVNIIPGMRSIYHWQGRIESGAETVLLAKTTAGMTAAVTARVKALHSYSVPCVLALPATVGNDDYGRWIRAETGPR